MRILTSLLILLASASGAGADDEVPVEGLLLVGELGCVSCHEIPALASSWLRPRAAPRLDGVASRLDPRHLRRFILAPGEVRPDTVMPDLLASLPADQRQDAANALVDFLVSRSAEPWQPHPPDRVRAAEGELLYHQVGCLACHEPFTEGMPAPADSQPLTATIDSWSQPQLARFLQRPHDVRPSGRMPSFGLSNREASAIAHFLLRETVVIGTLDLAIDRGHRKSLDEEGRSRPRFTGLADALALPERASGGDVTTHLSGWLRIDVAGEYRFHLTVDDLGRLSIDDQVVIDLAGELQRERILEESATVRLEPGWHSIAVDHFQWVEEAQLLLEWQGPGIDRGPIDADRLVSALTDSEPEAVIPWVTREERVAEGEGLYRQLGCATCHQPDAFPEGTALLDLPETYPAPPHPSYSLDPRQRQAIGRALAFLGQVKDPPAAAQRVELTMKAFGCSACHERGGSGGLPEDRRDFFTGSDPALGDEGRFPPTLSGVGDKLRREALAAAISGGAEIRPYLHARMPRFDPDQTEHLVEDLIELDRRQSPLPELTYNSGEAREAGRKMAGSGALQCILCHDFNGRESVGLRANDLVTTTERLNPDWFFRYLLDPESLRPGTQMPSLWPDGRSLMPELLGGDPAQQVMALWRYLEDGRQAVFPEGLSRKQNRLIVGGEAITYRGKLWEAGFRGIAVGLPGGLNYAFDAQELRLALIWKGDFLDVGAHWNVQGMGRVRPRGKDVVVFPHGPEIVFLTDVACPWPGERVIGERPENFRFIGYILGDRKIPTLMYANEFMEIEDTIVAVETAGESHLERRISMIMTEPTYQRGSFYMRLRDEAAVEVRDDGTCIYADGLEIRAVEGSYRPRKILNGGNWETWASFGNSADLEKAFLLEYRWGKEKR